jgi:hypothetical protein
MSLSLAAPGSVRASADAGTPATAAAIQPALVNFSFAPVPEEALQSPLASMTLLLPIDVPQNPLAQQPSAAGPANQRGVPHPDVVGVRPAGSGYVVKSFTFHYEPSHPQAAAPSALKDPPQLLPENASAQGSPKQGAGPSFIKRLQEWDHQMDRFFTALPNMNPTQMRYGSQTLFEELPTEGTELDAVLVLNDLSSHDTGKALSLIKELFLADVPMSPALQNIALARFRHLAHPDVVTLAQELLARSPNPAVRRTAAQVLADRPNEVSGERPYVLKLLQKRSMAEPDPAVKAAIEAALLSYPAAVKTASAGSRLLRALRSLLSKEDTGRKP